jgi:hypothetical protein
MDNKRSQAILGLFGPEGVPSEEHLVELGKAPKIKKGEEDKLFQANVVAFNNFKAWSKDHLAYVEQLKTTSQKVFLQRFLGVPEDTLPHEEPVTEQAEQKDTTTPSPLATKAIAPGLDELGVDDEDDGKPIRKAKPAKHHGSPNSSPKIEPVAAPVVAKPQPDSRQIALGHIFGSSSTSHLKSHVDAIGTRFRPEPGDNLVLPHETVEHMRLFAEDREGYIDSINNKTRPDLSESHIEHLKYLLHLLMDTGQKPDTDPNDGTPIDPAPKPLVEFKPATSPPPWAREVMSQSYWDKARTRIELAFENMKSSEPATKEAGRVSLAHWQQRMLEHKNGSSGEKLKLFGDYMLTVIRVLRMGANPKSPEYKHMYSNS